MKKVLAALIIVIALCGFAHAQDIALEWKSANERTLKWDPVTTLTDGTIIPESDSVTYVVYLVAEGASKESAVPIDIPPISITEYTFSIDLEGRYIPGVQAVRNVYNTDVISKSEISWSDNPENVANGVPFGIQYYLQIMNPQELR